MEFPSDLKYTEDHEWIRGGEDGTAVVGVTDFAQSELGDIVYVEVETVGETLSKGEIFGTIEAVKTTSDLYMPVSGEVLEDNPRLNGEEEDAPELVNASPYKDGWIVKIKLSDQEELDDLMDAEAYQESIK